VVAPAEASQRQEPPLAAYSGEGHDPTRVTAPGGRDPLPKRPGAAARAATTGRTRTEPKVSDRARGPGAPSPRAGSGPSVGPVLRVLDGPLPRWFVGRHVQHGQRAVVADLHI